MKTLMLMVVMAVTTGFTVAQEKLAWYFPAGQTNAGKLVEGYIAPMAEDISTLVNSGWVNTAATHDQFGFDISVSMNTIFVSNDNKYYMVPSLTGVSFVGNTVGNTDRIPTAYGNEGERPIFQYTNGDEFEGPDGFEPKETYGMEVQALPTLQLGFGLFKGTDIRVRYTPKFKIDEVESGAWGVGVTHDIKQHIPGLKALPFSLSVFLGYTRLDANVNLSGVYSGSGQEGVIEGNGFTGQVMISKSLSIITFYGALGYSQAKSTFDVDGTYIVDKAFTSTGSFPLSQPYTMTDPYSYSLKQSGVKATGGIRFKLGPITLNGDYSFLNSRNLLTAGFGLTFR